MQDEKTLEVRVAELEREVAYLRRRLERAVEYLEGSIENASEAEMLFSILMGENVEERRKYIEEHALEVKNLDV